MTEKADTAGGQEHPPSILAATTEDFARWLETVGEKSFRAKQIRRWIFEGRAERFDQMTDLPAPLRKRLEKDWSIHASTILRETRDDDQTLKLLLRLADGQTVETVLLFDQARRTVCLSTQVGCGMGCVFCASGLNGVVRNLTPAEMVEEILWLQRRLTREERLSHIVVMGMGEPLANLDSLLEALAVATSKEGLGISARHVTISTVGLPGRIRELASSGRPYHLAVSLHASNDEVRRRIVPTAGKAPLAEILAAADDFREITGRQVTFEYVLLGGVNDAPEHARELSALLGRRDAMINLIPYNPVAGLPYRTPASAATREFAAILRAAGRVVKIRKRRGSSIAAACGQLRRQTVEILTPGLAPQGGPGQEG